MPEIHFPVVDVIASMPGASPETMATSVATPLERHLGAIADVREMYSTSMTGSMFVALEFGPGRNLDGAARDVQAAINAARADLPAGVNPTYIASNTFGEPALFVSLTSATLRLEEVFDIAQAFIEQKLASVEGVSKAYFAGSSRYAIRVELNPDALAKYGIGLEDVRAALAAVNANSPKGAIQSGGRRFQIYTNDQISKAKDYEGLVIAYRKGLAVKLADVAEVINSVEDTRSAGFTNGVPSIWAKIYLRPDANLIATVDRIRARLPELRAFLPPGIDLDILSDRTVEIRAALRDLERVLLAAVALVILTVFAFLRDFRAALIPAIVVGVSLTGTFGVILSSWLQHQHHHPHGARHLHGACRRRRHHRFGEYRTPHRERHGACRGGAARRPRNLLYRTVHQRIACRDVHSCPAGGRFPWRIREPIRGDTFRRHSDFDGGLAHHGADAMCPSPQAGERAKARATKP